MASSSAASMAFADSSSSGGSGLSGLRFLPPSGAPGGGNALASASSMRTISSVIIASASAHAVAPGSEEQPAPPLMRALVSGPAVAVSCRLTMSGRGRRRCSAVERLASSAACAAACAAAWRSAASIASSSIGSASPSSPSASPSSTEGMTILYSLTGAGSIESCAATAARRSLSSRLRAD